MKRHLLFTFLSVILAHVVIYGQNTAYSTLYTTSTFDSKTINSSRPVGSIAASADVTPVGSAAYSIPIAVPPGTNGVAPNVSVVYNSMGTDGPLGRGWGLSGLSAIVRTSRNIYFDDVVYPVTLDLNDRFELDGTGLVISLKNNTIYGD